MEKRKAGRPLGSRNRERKDGVRINLYLDRQASEVLWALARERGESRNQTVEHLIAAAMRRQLWMIQSPFQELEGLGAEKGS